MPARRWRRERLGLAARSFDNVDQGDDLAIYAPPRRVTHIDAHAVADLTEIAAALLELQLCIRAVQARRPRSAAQNLRWLSPLLHWQQRACCFQRRSPIVVRWSRRACPS